MPSGTEPPVSRVAGRASLLLGLVVAAHMVVAFAPFRPDPPRPVSNGAHRRGDVIAIDGPALVRSPEPPAWLAEVTQRNEVAVHVTARSLEPDQDGPARLVAIEGGHTRADLMLGQRGADLVVRMRRSGSDRAGNPAARVPDVFGGDAWHRFDVVAADGELVVSVDGVPRVRWRLPAASLAGWDPGYRLHVGDAATGERSWHGEIRSLVAGSGGALVDYLRPGALEVPARFWYVPERVRDPVGWDVLDGGRASALAVVRLVSFVPVGALAAAAAGRRRAGRVLVAGAVVGLAAALQLGKVLFAGRHPALADMVIEVCGGALGAAAWAWWTRLRPVGPGTV